MPKKINPDLVGCLDCGCGSEMPVYQASSSYLYTRCPQCGVDQRNGPRVQAERWFTMRRIEGAGTRPKNVPEQVPDWLRPGPQAVQTGEQEVEPATAEPKVEEPKGESAGEGDADSGGGGLFWLLLAGVGIGVGAIARGMSS